VNDLNPAFSENKVLYCINNVQSWHGLPEIQPHLINDYQIIKEILPIHIEKILMHSFIYPLKITLIQSIYFKAIH